MLTVVVDLMADSGGCTEPSGTATATAADAALAESAIVLQGSCVADYSPVGASTRLERERRVVCMLSTSIIMNISSISSSSSLIDQI